MNSVQSRKQRCSPSLYSIPCPRQGFTSAPRMAMSERTREHLIAALKQALADPGEHRLYRSGKLAGLFASRSGAAGEAAAEAVREGLLEVIRTEARGKFTVEWVHSTPKSIEYLHAHESPIAALRELQAELKNAR